MKFPWLRRAASADGRKVPIPAASVAAASGRRATAAESYAGNQSDMTRWADVFQPQGSAYFSPGYPLAPVSPERVRAWDFPVGYNTIYTPRSYEPVDFVTLRALARHHDLTRLAIDTRKDQVESLEWQIKSTDETDPAADAPDRIKAVSEFWQRPDGDHPFATWLRDLLEDLLVIDAPAIEVRRTRGGDVVGLDVVDGSTFKLLLDDTGRRPKAPAPAYEQVIHGRPWRLLTTDELLYLPRNVRPESPYGYGPVEQILITINIALRRQTMQLQHFTVSNIPAGFANSPDNWTPDQIRQYQEFFDALLAGNTAERTKIVWGPAGAKYQAFREPPYKDGFDEWLARIVCFAFSLPPTPFVTVGVQRTTADTLQEAALKEGLAPLSAWVKRMADTVIQRYLGHTDLEFAWAEEDALDPQGQASVLNTYVRLGVYAPNEARAKIGLDPVEGGDDPMVYLPTGPMLLRDVVTASATAAQPAPPAGTEAKPGEPGAEGGNGSEPPPSETASPAGKRPRSSPTKQAAAGQISQADADYVDHPVGDAHCSLCGMFRAPDRCTLVEGDISPDGHCRYFEPEATEKAAARPLYVSRPLKNAADLIEWAKGQGFSSTLPADDMHVTIAFSREPLDWNAAGDNFDEIRAQKGARSVEPIGDKGAVALRFECQELASRWQEFMTAGASWDHPGYKPHVTLTYEGAPADLAEIEPYSGPLIFGPERFAELDDDWQDQIEEDPVGKAAARASRYARAKAELHDSALHARVEKSIAAKVDAFLAQKAKDVAQQLGPRLGR